MTQERIDLTKIETFLESAGQESGGRFVYDLIAELKRMYEKEDANKPCDCEDPDYAYYWHDASGCLTVIHGAAECTECGKAWDATQEGDWTIHFDRPTDNPYTG